MEDTRRAGLRPIFISYRREDAEGEAGRLFGDLVARFGEDLVFMDVAGLEAGLDFRRQLDESVAGCGVLLAVIGTRWLGATDGAGRRRLEDSLDFVRLETASALRREIPVIPVLVRGAKMPRPEDLPDDLKELAFRNALELSHARWGSDLKFLIAALERLLARSGGAGAARPRWIVPVLAGLVVCVALAACVIVLRPRAAPAGADKVSSGLSAAPFNTAGDAFWNGRSSLPRPAERRGLEKDRTISPKKPEPSGAAAGSLVTAKPTILGPTGELLREPKTAAARAAAPVPALRTSAFTYLGGDFRLDLDSGASGQSTWDIWLDIRDRDVPIIAPVNGALLSILNLENPKDDEEIYAACAKARYQAAPLQVANLVDHASLCVRTSEGRLSQFVIMDPGNAFKTGLVIMRVHYQTWEK